MHTFNGVEFRSKSARKAHVRGMIDVLGECVIGPEHECFGAFEELLSMHPRAEWKRGPGVGSYFIEQNPLGKSADRTGMVRVDGVRDTFSWVDCCNERAKTSNHAFSQAMRQAVFGQAVAFKTASYQEGARLECVLCSTSVLAYGSYHVDHATRFKEIAAAFVASVGGVVPQRFASCPVTKQISFRDEDRAFADAWAAFHASKCELQVLCGPCNLAKH